MSAAERRPLERQEALVPGADSAIGRATSATNARAVGLPASDEADDVRGTALFVDGRMWLYSGFRNGG